MGLVPGCCVSDPNGMNHHLGTSSLSCPIRVNTQTKILPMANPTLQLVKMLPAATALCKDSRSHLTGTLCPSWKKTSLERKK